MTIYIVKIDCFLFPDAASALASLAPAGTPILRIFDRFEGAFNATSGRLIDKTSPAPTGVADSECLMEVPPRLPGITTEMGRTNFCWAASAYGSMRMADRNYLLSVSYYLSKNLENFGVPADRRYGPFRYSAEEWFAAVDVANTANPTVPPSFEKEHLFDPIKQLQMAAMRTGKAMADYKATHNVYPLPLELFFYERLGEEGLKLLALAPDQTCAAAVTVTPPGSYGADIKDRKSGDVIKEVKDGLIAGFVASRADVGRLQPHRRFFSDEDMAPWLTVARLMTANDLSIKPTALAGTFMTFPPAMGPDDRRSAAFVAFCLIECGVTEAKEKRPKDETAGHPDKWENWAKEAVPPLRPGTIVITTPQADGKASIGILAETPEPTADKYKVYFCSETGTVSVGIQIIEKARIARTRWLDITGVGDPSDTSLGILSKRYESGSGGPGTISPGNDAGGVSYGTYQFSTANSSVANFVASLPADLRDCFAGKAAGSSEFGAAWTAVAKEDAARFGRLQHDFIKAQYYDKLAAAVNTNSGFNVNARSAALQNCFWSTAVQHGVGGATGIIRLVIDAMKSAGVPSLDPVKPFDKVALEKIYAERGSGPIGAMKYFSNNPREIQEGVAARFRSELADALKMLDGE